MPPSRRSVARLAALILLVVLAGGCAGQTDEPTAAAPATTTTVAPTTTTLPPLTAKELAWLKAIPTVSRKDREEHRGDQQPDPVSDGEACHHVPELHS
jgi:hypothetical protein